MSVDVPVAASPALLKVLAEPLRWRILELLAMGCGDACPLYPGKRYEDWELEDPEGQDVEAVRPIRDDIEQRVRALLASREVPVA